MRSSRRILIGQVIGQLALVAAIPVLTRLIEAEQMGVYQLAFSLALILQPLASLRLELVIPTSVGRRLRRRRSIGLLLPAGLALVGLAAALIVMSTGARLAAESIAATALLMFSLCMISIENAVLIRLGRGGRLATRNLLAGVLSAACQIGIAWFWPSGIALAIALLVGRLLATVATITRGTVTDDETDIDNEPRSFGRMLSAIVSGAVSNAASQAVVVATFIALGPTAAGLVGIAQRVAGTPTTLLGQALSQVMLVQAAPVMRARRPQMHALVRRQGLRTVIFAAACAAALITFGPILAGPVLGDDWAASGMLIAIFAVPLSLQLTTIPVSNLLIPLGREHGLLIVQTTRFVGVVTALLLSAAVSEDLTIVTLVTAITWSLSYLVLIVYTLRAARTYDNSVQGDDDPAPGPGTAPHPNGG